VCFRNVAQYILLCAFERLCSIFYYVLSEGCAVYFIVCFRQVVQYILLYAFENLCIVLYCVLSKGCVVYFISSDGGNSSKPCQ